jgi:hypothetical protein
MASAMYKDHLIVGSSDYEQTRGHWIPFALIFVFPRRAGSKMECLKTCRNVSLAELMQKICG